MALLRFWLEFEAEAERSEPEDIALEIIFVGISEQCGSYLNFQVFCGQKSDEHAMDLSLDLAG